MKNLTLASLSLVAIISLSGCGSSAQSALDSTNTDTITGYAVDPELVNAKVFVDANSNGTYDEGELLTYTDENGLYTLNIPTEDLDKAIIVTEGFDKATKKKFMGKFSALIETDATTQNITPLTTLVHNYKLQNSTQTLAEIKLQIASTLGVSVEDLDSNPVDLGNENILKIAMELEYISAYIEEKDSDADVYAEYAQASTNGANMEILMLNALDRNRQRLEPLDEDKLKDFHSELQKLQTNGFTGYTLALTIDNIHNKISDANESSALDDDIYDDEDMVVLESELSFEMGQREANQDMQNGGNDFNLSAYPESTLDEATKYTLAYMWNEERLAYDMYNALFALYPEQKSFINIATRSEAKHIDIVESLVERYDLNITNLVDYSVNYSEEELRSFAPGTYSLPVIQNLYDDLYTKGQTDMQSALEVGCIIEVVDVNDLRADIQTATANNSADVVAAFNVLLNGSYSHYWSYNGALINLGVAEGCGILGSEYAKTTEDYPVAESNATEGETAKRLRKGKQ
ncbi:DUF2202 domain-containing protein [Sulfurimonas aquatica]|uniref:DUF2202 domain-containing protein n=1 Tax=Sulfurimonas aquatica TaxID=2672570 RepID=A0A975AXV9_9BACT|nr:DUF2202 domain-containing protein [Sulfurimonas aquatica]QSZ40579.1 DUF2202 domain-containing protein [Sulfurimonas aquatica]